MNRPLQEITGESSSPSALSALQSPEVEQWVLQGEAAVPELCKTLGSGSEEARVRACAALERLRPVKALPWLVHAANERSPAVWMAAVTAISAYEPADGQRHLRELAKRSGDAALYAAELLVSRGDREVLPTLVLRLRRREDQRHDRVIQAIGKLGDPAGVEPLVEILSGARPGNRALAARALGELGSPRAVGALWDATGEPDLQEERLAALARLGAGAVAELVDLLRIDYRGVAEAALLRIGTSSAPALMHAMSHDDPEVRWRAARLLGHLGKGIGALTMAAKDPSPQVRAEAALGLASKARPSTTRTLHSILQRKLEDELVRVCAAISLVQHGQLSSEIVRLLTRGLSFERRIRERSARGLVRVAKSGALVDLNPAIRRLDRLGRAWTLPAEEKAVCQEALRQIRAAGDRLTDLPLPSDRLPLEPNSLPRPAAAPPGPGRDLPLPTPPAFDDVEGDP